MATEEGDLQPHQLGITIGLLQGDTLIECYFVPRFSPHQIRPVVVSIAQEVVVGNESVQWSSNYVNVQGIRPGVLQLVTTKVQVGQVSVVKGWFHCRPPGNVAHEGHLIGQGQDVHICCDVDVQHVESVLFAEIIGQVHEASRPGRETLFNKGVLILGHS